MAESTGSWDELPSDAFFTVISYLDVRSVLTVVPMVCRSWHSNMGLTECDYFERVSLESMASVLTDDHVSDLIQTWSKQTVPVRSVGLIRCAHVSDRGVAQLASHSGTSLIELDLRGCRKVTDVALLALGRFASGLESLSLMKCHGIGDVGLLALSLGCRGLRHLDLGYCDSLTDEGLSYLSGAGWEHKTATAALSGLSPSLASLLSPSQQEEKEKQEQEEGQREDTEVVLCGGLAGLDTGLLSTPPHLPLLTSLSLHGCWGVSSGAIRRLGQGCPRLSQLSLAGCRALDDSAIVAVSLCPLRALNLHGCWGITDVALESLSSCAQLESLNLSFCVGVTVAGVMALLAPHAASRHSLTDLNLDGCRRVSRRGLLSLSPLCPPTLTLRHQALRTTRQKQQFITQNTRLF